MTPTELKQANLERFERLLAQEANLSRRETLRRALEIEKNRPLDDYPDTVDRPR